jgi:hypothetical protein
MDNLQQALALVAPTGVGLLYTPYSQGVDISAWKCGGGAYRSSITFKRTQPKPTPTFEGVERGDFGIQDTWIDATTGITEIAVARLVTSIPVSLSLVNKQAFYQRMAILMADPTIKAAFETGGLPT